MYRKNTLYLIIYILFNLSCNQTPVIFIKNTEKGKLKSGFKLVEINSKSFVLDSITAPKTEYSQLFKDKNGTRYYCFYNSINNSIYFYNYETLNFNKKITFNRTGIYALNHITGFFIKSLDSIYLFDKAAMEISLANDSSRVFHRISLIANKPVRNDPWVFSFPQYDPQTAKPFLYTGDELIMIGQFMRSLPDSCINTFHILAHINLKTNKVYFTHLYPANYYGSNYDWDGQVFSEVYMEFIPDSKQLIFSFPICNDLYLSNLNAIPYKIVYDGSNDANTISSVDIKANEFANQLIISSFIKNDEYAAVKYDPFRQVYYRFIRRGIKNAKANTPLNSKPVTVIMSDRNFHYLGETTIGIMKNWDIANVFVTKEGLNIEYVNSNLDESKIVLKIFTIKKII